MQSWEKITFVLQYPQEKLVPLQVFLWTLRCHRLLAQIAPKVNNAEWDESM